MRWGRRGSVFLPKERKLEIARRIILVCASPLKFEVTSSDKEVNFYWSAFVDSCLRPIKGFRLILQARFDVPGITKPSIVNSESCPERSSILCSFPRLFPFRTRAERQIHTDRKLLRPAGYSLDERGEGMGKRDFAKGLFLPRRATLLIDVNMIIYRGDRG